MGAFLRLFSSYSEQHLKQDFFGLQEGGRAVHPLVMDRWKQQSNFSDFCSRYPQNLKLIKTLQPSLAKKVVQLPWSTAENMAFFWPQWACVYVMWLSGLFAIGVAMYAVIAANLAWMIVYLLNIIHNHWMKIMTLKAHL
jgi:hypothetical protein